MWIGFLYDFLFFVEIIQNSFIDLRNAFVICEAMAMHIALAVIDNAEIVVNDLAGLLIIFLKVIKNRFHFLLKEFIDLHFVLCRHAALNSLANIFILEFQTFQ